MARVKDVLTDHYIEAIAEFSDDGVRTVWDTKCPGLQARIGRRRVTFAYCVEYRHRGKRGTTFRRLGHWPGMDVAAARKAAQVLQGTIASGHRMPGRKDAVTLAAALVEYDTHLREQSKRRNKPATWARIVGSLSRLHLIPVLGNYSLAELANSPGLIRDWHRDVSKIAPVSANRCASILSAVYKHASRLDRSLPPHNPISAVRKNTEHAAQSGMPFNQFPEWSRAVGALPPIRAAFYRLCLLCGFRGGEAARLKWTDISCRARTVTIRNSKSGAAIIVPMSAAIAGALQMARDARPERDTDLIFPGARKWSDHLPASGHALRHTWASVAADLGVSEIHRRLLLGHSLVGVSQSYITAAALTGGPGLRASQRRVSARIVALLNG